MAAEENGFSGGSQPISAETDQGNVAGAGPGADFSAALKAYDVPTDRETATTALESLGETGSETGAAGPDAPAAPRQISANDIKQIRRAYFTVRHDRVEPCGHRFDRMNEPRTNCHSCWFAWLNSHGTLTQAVEEAFQKQGAHFVIKMRGQKFLKMFLKFMATVAAMQAAAQKETEKEAEIGQTGEMGGAGSNREVAGETVRD